MKTIRKYNTEVAGDLLFVSEAISDSILVSRLPRNTPLGTFYWMGEDGWTFIPKSLKMTIEEVVAIGIYGRNLVLSEANAKKTKE